MLKQWMFGILGLLFVAHVYAFTEGKIIFNYLKKYSNKR